ncbi:MAG: TetR/AcrR family transcriptional regulator [Velocimicrobium sp.]
MELIDRLFECCIEEFKESGVKFTMDSLAKRAGISKRTLYEMISSKNQAIELAIDRTFEDIKRQQKNILGNEKLDTLDKCRKLFAIVPTYASILDYRRINEIKNAYPQLYTKIETKIETDWESAIELLHQAQKEGIIRTINITVLKLMLCEVYERLINGEILIQNQISYQEAMDEMVSIIFDGICIRKD